MFDESMIETSWAQRSRRSWSTMTSFGLQALAVGFLMLLPLIKPVAAPFLRPLPTPLMLTVPAGPPPVTPHAASATRSTNTEMLDSRRIMMPRAIPQTVPDIHDEVAPVPLGADRAYVPGAPGTGSGGNVPFALNTGPTPALPAPPPIRPQMIRVSRMSEGDLIRKVQPLYPVLARSARIQGTVILVAIISRDGTIANLHAVQGHPMLIPAALDAVRQWRYRPYVLNQEPIEVETQITVNFSLSGN